MDITQGCWKNFKRHYFLKYCTFCLLSSCMKVFCLMFGEIFISSPIFKKGSKSKSINNHPICLTGIICKIIYIPAQHVFAHPAWMPRSKILWNTQVAVLDSWTEMLENGECIDILSLDFQKEFDSVPYCILHYVLSRPPHPPNTNTL